MIGLVRTLIIDAGELKDDALDRRSRERAYKKLSAPAREYLIRALLLYAPGPPEAAKQGQEGVG